MKTLLVAPPYALSQEAYFPLGIAYVSAMLKRNGYNVACSNNVMDPQWESSFLDTMRETKPDIIGVGGMTPSYNLIKRMLELAKKENPSIVTMVGGGVLSSESAVFAHLQADIGIMGEGELVSLELLDALERGKDVSGIDGIMYKKKDGSIVANKPHAYVQDLDELPIPDYHGFDFQSCYNAVGNHYMIASRGCPFRCTFCYSALGRGRYRCHSLDHVIMEIKYLVQEFGITKFGLLDEVFALKKERALDFCDLIEPLGLEWETQLRAEVVDDEMLRRMKQAGCVRIFYGLESMSPDVLRSMNKKLKPQQIDHALQLTYDNGINIFGNFIFGDPAETTETSWITLDWWLDHRMHFANLSKLNFWPGTQIYHKALESGAIEDRVKFIEDGCPLVNITSMPWDEFFRMLKRIWTLHEALLWPGKLVEAAMDGPEGASVVLICPHCKKPQHFSRLQSLPMDPDRNAHRMNCPDCTLKFDIPLRCPPTAHAPEVVALFESALVACGKGDTDDACNTLEQLIKLTYDHPVAVFLAAAILLARRDYGRAAEMVRLSLKHNPSAPYLLDIAAVAYHRDGDDKMAYVMLKQAGLLRASRTAVLTPETLSALDPMEYLLRTLFPAGALPLDAGLNWDMGQLIKALRDRREEPLGESMRWRDIKGHQKELAQYGTIAFFGASGGFLILLDEIKSLLSAESVVAILDNSAAKHGQKIADIPIMGPAALKELKADLVVITSAYHKSIIKQLRSIREDDNLTFEIRYVEPEEEKKDKKAGKNKEA